MYIVVLKKDNGERHKHSDMTTNYTFLYYSEIQNAFLILITSQTSPLYLMFAQIIPIVFL